MYGEVLPFHFLVLRAHGEVPLPNFVFYAYRGGSDTIFHVLRPHGEVPLLYFVFHPCMGGSVALFLFYTCMGRFHCCIL